MQSLDYSYGISEYGQIAYAQEVEFGQAGVFHSVHVVLGYNFATFGIELKGREVG
jgi:hypothetical protein